MEGGARVRSNWRAYAACGWRDRARRPPRHRQAQGTACCSVLPRAGAADLEHGRVRRRGGRPPAQRRRHRRCGFAGGRGCLPPGRRRRLCSALRAAGACSRGRGGRSEERRAAQGRRQGAAGQQRQKCAAGRLLPGSQAGSGDSDELSKGQTQAGKASRQGRGQGQKITCEPARLGGLGTRPVGPASRGNRDDRWLLARVNRVPHGVTNAAVRRPGPRATP